MNYVVEMGSGAAIYNPGFIKIGCRCQLLMEVISSNCREVYSSNFHGTLLVLKYLLNKQRKFLAFTFCHIQDDSKLLSGFPWPVDMEVKAVMHNPPNSRLCYT
jgi:hypothetical protein